MEVTLRNNWFGPDGRLYAVADNPHKMVDDWRSKLPESAKVAVPEVTGEEVDEAEKSARLLARKLQLMTVARLHEYAREHDIEFETDMNKSALIDTILAAQE